MEVNWSLVLTLFTIFVTQESFAKTKRGYLITAPRTFRTGVNEKVLVQLFNTTDVWVVEAKLYLLRRSGWSLSRLIAGDLGTFSAQNSGMLTIKVPEHLNIFRTGKNGKLVVSAKDHNRVVTIKKTEVAVTIEKREPSLFIQTDKSIYKPGQKVLMRIIGTDPDLKPLDGKVTRVSVTTPTNTRVMQWNNQRFVDGIVSLEMQLSKQPVLGYWKIEARTKDVTVSQTIKIAKYVLPKFEVKINPPSFVAVDIEEVSASICATYTYGQPVKGTVIATFTVTNPKWYRHAQKAIQVTKKLNGCRDFHFTRKELDLFELKNHWLGFHLKISAIVTEEATGVSCNATDVTINIVKNRIQLAFTPDTPRKLKPGLPFHGKLAVTQADGTPVSGEKVTIRSNSDSGHFYEKQFTVTNGLVHFTIPSVSNSSTGLDILAIHHSLTDPLYGHWFFNTMLRVNAWYSPSGSFVSLSSVTKPLTVGKTAQVGFKFTTRAISSPVTIYYSVMSKGALVASGNFIQTFLPNKKHVASGNLRFDVSQAMVPSCRLLVYYIRDNGETVADSIKVDIADRLENQVSVQFENKIKKPGEKTRLFIKAAPGSRIAIAAVDKSVNLLRAANELTESKVISKLKRFDVGPANYYRRKKCLNRFGRIKRSSMPWFSFYGPRKDDSSKAFNDAGMVYISNLEVESAPCPKLIRVPYRGPGSVGPGGSGRGGTSKAVRKVRQNFPETWLWIEDEVDKTTGKKTITATVPDTITSWYASAFAMSKKSGIGIASPTSLTAFQPFFVSLTLPYSVIRGEELTVTATVFNYLSSCLTIQVNMETTQDFTLKTKSSSKLCVCSSEAKSVAFTIVASKLGRIPLTVAARDVQHSICANSSAEESAGAIDVVKRKLLVEPEGIRKEFTFSQLVCPKDSPNGLVNEKISLTLPQKVVPGSVYGTLSAIGDLMGPALSGLDNLLRIPTGCGEQNMVLFAPNIYILQYLKRTQQLTEAIKKKATHFLQIGYQRELTYKRTDGSYSAFGKRDNAGSLWLTAFVLRSFAQARQFIFVDENELQHTIKWLKSKQTSSGCFPKYGRLLNKNMKGGITTPVTLTAFTVLALIEAGGSYKDSTISRALDKCILPELPNVNDAYSLALLAYTFAIAKHSQKDVVLRRLYQKAITKDGLTHWKQASSNSLKNSENIWVSPYYQAPAADIEMTSYALMATIQSGSRADIKKAIPIVRWLSTQRNGLGGFRSTQDTCVGLMALAQFAALAYSGGVSLSINIQGSFSHSFSINDHNRMVLKRVEIPSSVIPTELTMKVNGTGCALVQADVSYYVPKVLEKPAFNLTVDLRQKPLRGWHRASCVPLVMHICARWLRKGTPGMAIVKVKLVSGFRADKESLDTLINLPTLPVKRFEVEGQVVNIYFDEIKDVCFSFGIFQESIVKNIKPGSVTVYDYYEPALLATKLYSITKERCIFQP